MARFSALLSSPLRKTPKAICPSCGEPFVALDFDTLPRHSSRSPRKDTGNGRVNVFCGRQSCYAEAIRAYWRRMGYEATVKYEDGCPRLVGVPVKM